MKIACLLADGFEDIEALGTIALLRRSGIVCDLVHVFNKISVTGSFGTEVITTLPIKQVNVADYDGVFIPGGRQAFVLRESKAALDLVKAFHESSKWLMAICAGPTVLGVQGILDNVKYTSFPGTESFMPKGIRQSSKAVRDGFIITGIGAGAVYEFAFLIIESLLGKPTRDEIVKRIQY